MTKIGFRRGTFLRGFMSDFIERFAPHLDREIQTKVIQARSKEEVDDLFKNIELPVY